MKRILSLIIAYFVFIGQAFAVTGIPDSRVWVPAGFGGGGSYSMILSDNTDADKLYLISDTNDPWVSTNAGDDWSQLPNLNWKNDYTSYIAQDPNDDQTLWAIGLDTYFSGGSVMKSVDAGQSWSKKASLPGSVRGYRYISIDPTDGDHVFVASRGSVWESTDGETFTERVIKPFSSRASAYTTKVNCENAGGSWSTSTSTCTIGLTFVYYDQDNNDLIIGSGSTRIGAASFGMVIYDLDTNTQSYIDLTGTNGKQNFWYDTYEDLGTTYFCTTAGLKIACSSDYSTWNYTTNIYWDSTYYIEHFVIHKLVGGIRIIADARWNATTFVRLMKRSLDFGATWSTVSKTKASTADNPTNVHSSGGLNVFSITEDQHDDQKIYFTNDWAAYISTNGGANFYEKTKGAQIVVVTDIDISPPFTGAANGRIFASMMDAGIAYSDNDGTSWTVVFPNATQPHGTWGGHTWRILALGTPEQWEAGTGVVVATHTVYQSGKYYWNYVLRSTNNGATFTPILLIDKDLYNGLWGNGFARGLAASASGNTIYVTIDGDNCQYNTSLPSTCPSASDPTPSNWITGGLFKSTDMGATWARSNGHPRITTLYSLRRVFNALAVDPTVSSGNTLLFGSFGTNIYRTTLGGTSDADNATTGWGWTGGLYTSVDLRFGSDNVPVAVGVESGNPSIWRAIVTDFGPAHGGYGTWQRMKTFNQSGIGDGLEIDPVYPNRIFFSTREGTDLKGNRKVYATWNAQKGDQASWSDITGNLPIKGCQDLEVNQYEGSSGYLWCAGNGGGMLKLDMTATTTGSGRKIIGGSTSE